MRFYLIIVYVLMTVKLFCQSFWW